MNLISNCNLKSRHTFGLNVSANSLAIYNSENDINEILDLWNLSNDKPRFILGAGSNVLFTRDFSGLIISVENTGVEIIEHDADSVIIKVAAGENWHQFVKYTVDNDFFGLENLALIPGKLGAAPVQNIGAYGVEQSKYFYALDYVDLESGLQKQLNSSEMEFNYRHSIFKESKVSNALITHVYYKLNRDFTPQLDYKEVPLELEKNSLKINAKNIFEIICKIRSRKLPDTKILGNAGSFFKNPVVNIELYEKLKAVFAAMPSYPQPNDKIKLSAGWLIEQAGWKGYRRNDAGVYEKHALALVNYGAAKGEEMFELAMDIKVDIYNKFSVELEPEVIFI